jgi:protein gp37
MTSTSMPALVIKLLEREGTGISWADLTMNFWIGCQEVSPACDHCYAREFTNARVNAARKAAGKPPIVWGPGGAREQTSPANRKKPLRWNRIAAEAGVRFKVFCSSLSDWADKHVPDEWRAEIAETILATPNLDWMLLTKRIGNAEAMLRKMFPDGVPPNVWIGITICNQEEADRDIPRALSVRRSLRISRLFISAEPLLGSLDLRRWFSMDAEPLGIDLLIVGGESGRGARPLHPDWVRSLRDQCDSASVYFHFKQWGEYLPVFDRDVEDPDWRDCGRWQHERPKGQWHNLAGGMGFHGERVVYVDRVGTRKAGHLLDGVEHREMMT